jgi:hypothetical protein
MLSNCKNRNQIMMEKKAVRIYPLYIEGGYRQKIAIVLS